MSHHESSAGIGTVHHGAGAVSTFLDHGAASLRRLPLCSNPWNPPTVLWSLLPLFAFAACSRPNPPVPGLGSASASEGVPPPPEPLPAPSTPPASEAGACSLPASPRELVLQINRHVVPIGREITHEVAEVTADGSCTPRGEFVRVTTAKMRELLVRGRAATGVRHRKVATSPHYGFRSIAVRFHGGACEIADGSVAPLVEEDRPTFHAAFDAIVDAVLFACDGGAPAPRGR